MECMDQEIEQLLHSLNVTTAPVERRARPAAPRPAPKVQRMSWLRRQEPWVLWVGCLLLLVKASLLAFFFVHGVPERWISRERKIFRVHEAAEVEQMAPLPYAITARSVWSSDSFFPHALPEGSLAGGSLFKEHLDILQAASGRRKALEEIRHDVDSLMAACIHAPDRSMSDALHRALLRFDLTDLDLTHSVVSMILSKRPLMKTSRDVRLLDETLSLAGLGRGLKEYSATLARMAAAKKTAREQLSRVEADHNLVHLAQHLRTSMQFLDDLHENPTIASSVDIQSHRQAILDRCRHSLEQIMAKSGRRLTPEERMAVGYFKQTFPEISMDVWTRFDGSLVPVVPARLAIHSENAMGQGGLLAQSSRVMLAPDVSFPSETSLPVAKRK